MTAKEATEVALRYFNDLFSGYNYSDARLEEVEKHADNWLITLGYLDRTQEGFSLGIIRRKYKVFTIESSTREVISVKIRNVE